MSIRVKWGNEANTYLVWELVGKWTWEEYKFTFNQAYAMIERTDDVVDVLVDITQSHFIPFNSFPYLRQAILTRPANMGVILLIGCNRSMKIILDGFARIYDEFAQMIAYVETLEEAHAILEA